MKRSIMLAIVLGATALGLGSLRAADDKKDPKPYPLDTCVVSGEKIELGEGVVFAYEGREIKTCCKDCKKQFEATPAEFVGKVDAAAKKVRPYPMKTCIISGEELGGMGKPVVFVRESQEVKLCCKGCLKDFAKNSKELVAKIKKTEPVK